MKLAGMQAATARIPADVSQVFLTQLASLSRSPALRSRLISCPPLSLPQASLQVIRLPPKVPAYLRSRAPIHTRPSRSAQLVGRLRSGRRHEPCLRPSPQVPRSLPPARPSSRRMFSRSTYARPIRQSFPNGRPGLWFPPGGSEEPPLTQVWKRLSPISEAPLRSAFQQSRGPSVHRPITPA